MTGTEQSHNGREMSRTELEALYEKHAPGLLGLCMRYCGNRADAEDVLHDGFIKIIRNIGSFRDRGPGSFEGWMKRIIVNTALNFLRDTSRAKTLFDASAQFDRIVIPDEDDNPFEEMAGKIDPETVMEMICELPKGYRTVFNLYVFESFSHKEIAQTLNCNENTSKSQLSKARQWLRYKVNDFIKHQEAVK